MAEIRFTKAGCSNVFGVFRPGDVLRCSDSEARHLVEEAGAAVYVEPPPDPARVSQSAKPAKRRNKPE